MSDYDNAIFRIAIEQEAEPEDFTGEDGLLYCGSCRQPKEAYFPEGKVKNTDHIILLYKFNGSISNTFTYQTNKLTIKVFTKSSAHEAKMVPVTVTARYGIVRSPPRCAIMIWQALDVSLDRGQWR